MSTFAQRRAAREDEFSSTVHVYEPHRVGLPPLRTYLRELWRRRELAFELGRSELRAQHFNTVLGQLWLLLNPLFLGLVYFALVTIVRGGSRGSEFFAHLLLGLFTFQIVSVSIRQGAKSVVGGGRLILNIAFPRALLPLSSVWVAFIRFLATLVVYAFVHALVGLPVTPEVLWAVPIIALVVVFAAGVTMLAAAVQVYFRDLRQFLRYFLRIWLYASPILYYASEVPERLEPMLLLNPLYPMLTALSEAAIEGQTPSAGLLAGSVAWAAAALVVGGLFFISREREFAVRL
jgi:ABC-type polysaccharide/polyol phosphate export permease